jgi:hypothetical protein
LLDNFIVTDRHGPIFASSSKLWGFFMVLFIILVKICLFPMSKISLGNY